MAERMRERRARKRANWKRVEEWKNSRKGKPTIC